MNLLAIGTGLCLFGVGYITGMTTLAVLIMAARRDEMVPR